MSILSKSVALTRFKVFGIPADSSFVTLFPIFQEALQKYRFTSIEDTEHPESVGWTQINDSAETDFTDPGYLMVDEYLFFTFRRDVRRVPGAVLRGAVKRACDEWLTRNPTFRRVPKNMKAEIEEGIKGRLLQKTLPVPTTTDLILDTRAGELLILTASMTVLDMIITAFKTTFPALSLQMVIPLDLFTLAAEKAGLVEAAHKVNMAGTESISDRIESNRWLAADFFRWLLWEDRPTGGTPEAVWIDNKITLAGPSGDGIQKNVFTGPLTQRMSAVLAALREARDITEAIINIENGDGNQWQFCLTGATFQFKGYKTPPVKIEADGDPASEFQAVLLERVYLLNSGFGYLQTILGQFAAVRVTDSWPSTRGMIQEWIDGVPAE